MKLLPLSQGWTQTIDALAKLLTAAAIIIGGGWSVFQYWSNRADQLRAQQLEASKPFLEKRLQYYIEVTTATSTIATSKNPDEVVQAKQKFWMLYNGPLLVVEEPAIQERVHQFAVCVDDPKCNIPLTDLSQSLAVRAGVSAGNTWRIPSSPTGSTVKIQ